MGAPTFELERFERVDAGHGTVLLRISGRWRAQRPERLSDAGLIVDDGRSRRRIAALPGPEQPAPPAASNAALWRAAFPIPAGMLAGGAVTYALESSVATFELPSPSKASPRAAREAIAEPSRALPRDDENRRRAQDDSERAPRERRAAMRVLEQRLQAERSARAVAERDALEARDELARSRAETAERAERRLPELKQRLTELEQARVQLAAEADRVPELERAVAEREQALAELSGEREQAEAAIAGLREEAREMREALACGEQEARGLVARVASLQQERAGAARAMQEARGELASARAEAEQHLAAKRAAREELQAATTRTVELEHALEARELALAEASGEREQAEAVIAGLREEARGAREALACGEQDVRALVARVTSLEKERDGAAHAAGVAGAELASMRDQAEQAERHLAAERTAREELRAVAESVATRTAELERALAEREQALAELSGEREQAEAVIAGLREDAREVREALARGEQEARGLVARVASLQQERAGAVQALREARAEIASARTQAEQGLVAERAAREAMRAAAETAAARLDQLQGQLGARSVELERTLARTRQVERERDQAATSARRAAKRRDTAQARARGLERALAEARTRTPSEPATLEEPKPRVQAGPRGILRVAHAIAERARDAWPDRRRAESSGAARTEPVADRRARVFVWVCFTLILATSAYLVLRAGRNIPIQEDWHVIAAATGHQYDFWSWVWLPNNEHRVPIAKLVYVALFQLWPDFRVGMIFNLAALAGIAAAFVVFMRRLRGRTRWTDAFFPLIFLHLGNWENFGWSWQLTFVIGAAVAAAMLMLIALPRPWTTRRAALLVGCMLVTPFTGATALPFAAAVAVAVLAESRQVAGRPRIVLATGAGLTLTLSALYFVDLPKSTWVPASPGLLTDVLTSGKFLALGLGPAAGAWWLLSILAVAAALASAAWLLWQARGRGGLLPLAFLGAGVLLAISLGRGRAGAVPFFGLPDRYVLVATPVICAIYIVWDRFGGARARHFGPALLCGAMLALLPLNAVYGAQWKDWYQDRVDVFQADVATGVPLAQLIRYRPLGWDPKEMWMGMQYLRVREVGVFTQLRLAPPPVRAWSIDGFAGGGAGWETLRGTESQARLVTHDGQREMRWKYAATSRAPAVLGRRFDTPASWRGAGALAFTVAGQATQRRVRVRITLETPEGALERFDTWFSDTTSDTRTVVMPWNGFGRANARGEFVDNLKGPLPLTGIRSATFIIGDTGPGVLRIKRLALTPGHPQLGWPLHSAVQRSSLPPLQ